MGILPTPKMDETEGLQLTYILGGHGTPDFPPGLLMHFTQRFLT